MTVAGWISALVSAGVAVGVMFTVMYSTPPDSISARRGAYMTLGYAFFSFFVLMFICKFVVGAFGGSLLKPQSADAKPAAPKKPPAPAIVYQLVGAVIGALVGFVLGMILAAGGSTVWRSRSFTPWWD